MDNKKVNFFYSKHVSVRRVGSGGESFPPHVFTRDLRTRIFKTRAPKEDSVFAKTLPQVCSYGGEQSDQNFWKEKEHNQVQFSGNKEAP